MSFLLGALALTLHNPNKTVLSCSKFLRFQVVKRGKTSLACHYTLKLVYYTYFLYSQFLIEKTVTDFFINDCRIY